MGKFATFIAGAITGAVALGITAYIVEEKCAKILPANANGGDDNSVTEDVQDLSVSQEEGQNLCESN